MGFVIELPDLRDRGYVIAGSPALLEGSYEARQLLRGLWSMHFVRWMDAVRVVLEELAARVNRPVWAVIDLCSSAQGALLMPAVMAADRVVICRDQGWEETTGQKDVTFDALNELIGPDECVNSQDGFLKLFANKFQGARFPVPRCLSVPEAVQTVFLSRNATDETSRPHPQGKRRRI